MSLLDAQRNYAALGVCEKSREDRARAAQAGDARDPGWRPLDPAIDAIEVSQPGVDYGKTYPSDNTCLYYWRPTYWRRKENAR